MDKVQKINKCLSWDKEWGCSTSPMKTCDSCLEAKWETVKENPEEHNEDLENAAIAYSCSNPSERSNGMYDQTDIEWAFEAGAEWQKQKDFEDSLKSDMTMPNKFYEKGRFDMRQQMMKDAVEGEYWDGSIYLDNRPIEYKDGDKVKIIIVKTE